MYYVVGKQKTKGQLVSCAAIPNLSITYNMTSPEYFIMYLSMITRRYTPYTLPELPPNYFVCIHA